MTIMVCRLKLSSAAGPCLDGIPGTRSAIRTAVNHGCELAPLRGYSQCIEKTRRRSQGQLDRSARNIGKTEAGGPFEWLARGVLRLTVEYFSCELRVCATGGSFAGSPLQRKAVVGIRAAIGHGHNQLVMGRIIGHSGERVGVGAVDNTACCQEAPYSYEDQETLMERCSLDCSTLMLTIDIHGIYRTLLAACTL